jgi:uncharacterized protein DUF6221
MTTLHERLQEAVNERLRIAEEATPEWDAPVTLAIVTSGLPFEVISHAGANVPARIIRDCQRDLRVLERHAPTSLDEVTVTPRPAWCLPCCEHHPCPEIRDLAEAYQIDLEVSDDAPSAPLL